MFNPPHIAHLVCAQEALVRLGLERVVLVPVNEASHREVDQDPGAEARVEMCRLAVSGDPRLDVSRIEVDREGPSYTVETLRELRRRHPEVTPVFILGADQARLLPRWHEPEEVLRLATVAVAEREDARREAVREAVAGLDGGEAIEFFDMPRIDVSSSLVRRRVAEGEPIRYLVPDGVAEYVVDRGLYRAPMTAGTRS